VCGSTRSPLANESVPREVVVYQVNPWHVISTIAFGARTAVRETPIGAYDQLPV